MLRPGHTTCTSYCANGPPPPAGAGCPAGTSTTSPSRSTASRQRGMHTRGRPLGRHSAGTRGASPAGTEAGQLMALYGMVTAAGTGVECVCAAAAPSGCLSSSLRRCCSCRCSSRWLVRPPSLLLSSPAPAPVGREGDTGMPTGRERGTAPPATAPSACPPRSALRASLAAALAPVAASPPALPSCGRGCATAPTPSGRMNPSHSFMWGRDSGARLASAAVKESVTALGCGRGASGRGRRRRAAYSACAHTCTLYQCVLPVPCSTVLTMAARERAHQARCPAPPSACWLLPSPGAAELWRLDTKFCMTLGIGSASAGQLQPSSR